MNEESINNNIYPINNNNEEEAHEESDNSDDENNNNYNYNKQNILLCPNKKCNSIPEIYFDENSSMVYLFCKNNKNKEKHKYYIPLKKYLQDNTIMSSSKLKDEEEKELQEINRSLPDELNQEIEDMKNKIKLKKKYFESLTNIFNSLIRKLVNDYTLLLENKLSIFLLEKKIIYTFLKYHTDKNAIKNFQNLSNFIQNMPIPNNTILNNDEKNAYNKNFINNNEENIDNEEESIGKKQKNSLNNMKNILERIKKLTKIFNYFDNTSHHLMSINKRKEVIEIGINNICILKDGNCCFSSDFGEIAIYRYNKKINNLEFVNRLKPLRNGVINYVTQLSNELLVCCSKKLIIGKLIDNGQEFEVHQMIDEFDNYQIVKVIELSNKYLATYDRGYQISIFKPYLNNENKIEYHLLYNKINKGEHIYSLLALPLNQNNIIQFISTSSNFSSNGNNCLRFYSSEKNYQIFDTIYDINCCRCIDSVIMINNKILCVGVDTSSLSTLNGIALININTRQIVTFIQGEIPTAIYKLKNELIAVAINKSSSEEGELIPEKKINFYYINDNSELIFINTVNSGMKSAICSFGELNNLDELIVVGNQLTNIFQ